MTSAFDLLFGLLANPWVPWLLAGGIIVYAIAAWIWFRQLTNPIIKDIERAISVITASPENKKGFAQRYEDVRSELLGIDLLRHAWTEFEKTLIPANGYGTIRNSHESSLYFNEPSLVAPNVNIRLYHSVPNILVGLGLLFTFVGLVAALYFASKGVMAADVTAAQKELSNLLHAATFKFVTSIAGLCASLVFSWREKHRFHKINIRLNEFCNLLDRRMDFVTTEKLQSEQLLVLRRQTEQLERFNTDLAISIASALDERLADSMAKAIGPLAQAIATMADRIGGVNQDAISKMIQEFSGQLHASTGKEMEALKTTMNGLVASLDQSAASLQGQIRDMVGGMENQITRLTSSLEGGAAVFSERMVGSAQAVGATFGECFSSMTRASEGFVAGVKELERLTNGWSVTFGKMDSLLSGINDPITQLRLAGEPLRNLAQKLEGLVSTVDQAYILIGKSVESLTSAGSELNNTSKHVESAWQSYQTRFENVDKSVERIFVEIGTGLEAYTKKIQDFVSALDTSFGVAMKHLSRAIQELGERIDDLENIVVPPQQ